MSCVDPLVPGFFFFFSLAYLIVRVQYVLHETCRAVPTDCRRDRQGSGQQWALSAWVVQESEVLLGVLTAQGVGAPNPCSFQRSTAYI